MGVVDEFNLDKKSLKLYKDYWIQSKDVKISEFRFDEFGFAADVKKLETDTSFCNLVQFDNGNTIDSWLEHRLLPLNRENGARLLHNKKLANIQIIASNQLFLSLSDTFWLNPKESPKRWDEVSLYQNNIDINLYELALYGRGEGISNKSGLTPEYTTGGHLAKGWLYDESADLWSLKKGAGYYPGEPLSEVLCYEISKQLEFDATEYTYEERIVDNVVKSYSICPNFTDENWSFLPGYSLAEYSKFSNNFENDEFFLQDKYIDQFKNMCVLDAITFNDDRHYNNFGVMFNSNTGEIDRFSPLFDSGQSLLYKTFDDDLMNYASTIRRTQDLKTRLPFAEMLQKYNITDIKKYVKDLDIDAVGNSFEEKFPERISAIRSALKWQIDKLEGDLA